MKLRLMRAAETVFHDRGYQGARVSDIVGLAGVAQGSFYLHFKSKRAIFLELIDTFFSDLITETLGTYPAARVQSREDIRAQIHAMWTILIGFCRARPALTRLALDAQSSLAPEDRQRLTWRMDTLARAVAEYGRATIEMGLVKPLNPDLVGWVIVGMVERAIHYAVFEAPETDVSALADDLAAIELTGILMTDETEGQEP